MLDRGDAAHRETTAIAGAFDVVNDRCLDVAGAQEIGMQGMRCTFFWHGLLGRRQRLAQDLPTEHEARADVATFATK